MTLAKGDTTKTLLYGLFIGCFLAAGAFSLGFLLEVLALSLFEAVDSGVILLFATGLCFVVGFFLDGRHTRREIRRKNLLAHQKMLALKQEQQAARDQGLNKRGGQILRSNFAPPILTEGIEDYSGKLSLNKGMVLLLAGLIDFIFLFWYVLFL
ncbi:MAG: hypothetical protein ACFFB3_18310 [Candidatus Hodarchaeota archaeon]